jgi:hypothetical protein
MRSIPVRKRAKIAEEGIFVKLTFRECLPDTSSLSRWLCYPVPPLNEVKGLFALTKA